MSNKEKAREIGFKTIKLNDLEAAPSALTTAAMVMAEWKDHQFKEYLENKIEPFIRTNASPQGTYQEGFDDGYTSAIDEIINELFNNE